MNENLMRISGKVGEERYLHLADMARCRRAHFDADLEDKTDDPIEGRERIEDMRDLLKAAKRKRSGGAPQPIYSQRIVGPAAPEHPQGASHLTCEAT